MNELSTLYNVIDIRTNNLHSVAIVKKRNAKWFVPYDVPVSEEEIVTELEEENANEPSIEEE